MTEPVFPQIRHWILLAIGLAAFYVFCLGSRGLNEPDEGRYANIARTMVLSGDWWEPRMSGFGHYDKPPLIYWTTALSLRVFGMNAWAARAPSLLGAALALTGLGWAASRLRGPRVAWWAVLICGSSVQFYVLARVPLARHAADGLVYPGHRGLGGVPASRGFLALVVGVAGVLDPGLVDQGDAGVDSAGRAAGGCFDHARRSWPEGAPCLAAFPVDLGAGRNLVPVDDGALSGTEALLLWPGTGGRMAGRVDGRHGSKFYYLPISAIAWLPWWPWAAWAGWKNRAALRARPGFAGIGLEWWLVIVGVIIFSLAASKLPTYTLTLAPWAALGMAALIVRPRADGEYSARIYWPAAVVVSAFAVVVATGVFVLPHFESSLGVNSSLREICAYLRQHGAKRVDADQYWPGMEFYLGDDTPHYVVNDDRQQERLSDPGAPPLRFIDPERWPAMDPPAREPADFWLVRYTKRKESPFDAVTGGKYSPSDARIIGQFAVIHVQSHEGGELTLLPPTP